MAGDREPDRSSPWDELDQALEAGAGPIHTWARFNKEMPDLPFEWVVARWLYLKKRRSNAYRLFPYQ